MDTHQMFGDFLTAIKVCFSKYLDPNGRATRSEFWYFFLFSCIISALFNSGSTGIGGLISLILFLPSLMVGIRRLHDVDKSGWWMLFIFLPVIGFFILIIQFAKTGSKGDNQFGPEPHDLASFRPDEEEQSMDFNYEDLPHEEDVAPEEDVKDAASRTKDRYGREIGVIKDKRKKDDDFLEG